VTDLTDLRDLRADLGDSVLSLPIGGTVYRVAECTADVWAKLQLIAADLDRAIIDDAPPETEAVSDESELWSLALGEDVHAAMSAAVSRSELQIAGFTAYLWQIDRRDMAAAYWASGGKAPASNRAQRRSGARTAGKAASPAAPAPAPSTRPRASTAGTRTRKGKAT
jgi:hypothetical protein